MELPYIQHQNNTACASLLYSRSRLLSVSVTSPVITGKVEKIIIVTVGGDFMNLRMDHILKDIGEKIKNMVPREKIFVEKRRKS